MNLGQNAKRFWVEDGCLRQNYAWVGGWKPKSFEASVRCCSNTNGGRPCKTPFRCDNKMTFDEAVTVCADNNQRLCTKKEIYDHRCCSTGGGCDGHLVWTSTPDPRSVSTGYDLNYFCLSSIF